VSFSYRVNNFRGRAPKAGSRQRPPANFKRWAGLRFTRFPKAAIWLFGVATVAAKHGMS